MHLSIHLLGPFYVTLDGKPVTGFESNKVRALLVYLALEADRPHSRDALIGLLWPDQSERAARRNLSQALFNLRHAIHDEAEHPFLCITREAVQFNPQSDYEVDAAEFAAQIATVEAHTHTNVEKCQDCIQRLEQAEALYRGEFLSGFFVNDSAPFSDWVVLRRERFHRQVIDVQHHLADYYELYREYARARYYAQRQVELESWREEAHQQLMRLLTRTGQRSAALHQYETCRRILADELGIEPSEDTTRLYRRIKTVAELGAHNLPPQSTRFVGRQVELRELSRRLADPACRLLTLLGPGGIGKTRLAIQSAFENRTAFLHGVCFVPLAPLQSTEFLVLTIADALHIQSSGDIKEQLLNALRGREMLLVLDNFEHLIQDGVEILADIVRAAPEVKLLVTSRERLDIYGETVFDVGGLKTPDELEVRAAEEYGAVELFMQSADRAQAGFAPAGGLADVTRICRLVEGMPLGIELAAAWVRTLSCQQIAAEIEQNLAFLSAPMKGLPARHRSVQAVFDHSWERLSDEERRVFVKLSVFRGGFDQQAASQVAGATLPALSALLDKSFIRTAPVDRYGLHELLRQYATEKLAQSSRKVRMTQDKHCCYYADWVNSAYERFQAGQQRQALDAIESELDNVRAAWQYALDRAQYAHLDMLMKGMYVFCYIRSEQDGDFLFGKAVAALKESVAGRKPIATECSPTEGLWLLGKLLWRWGYFVRIRHTVDETTETLFRHSVALLRSCGDKIELAQALDSLGRFLDAGGRFVEARHVLEESIEVGRRLPDSIYLARALTDLGGVLRHCGEMALAKQLLEEGLALHQKLGDLMGTTFNLSMLGGLNYYLGNYAEAKRIYLENKTMYEELGNPGRTIVVISNIGHASMELGEYEDAACYLHKALQRVVARYHSRFSTNILHGVAELASKTGRYLQAFELATFVAHNPMTFRPTVEMAQRMIKELETRLPPEVVAAAKSRALAWTLDDAAIEALGLLEEKHDPA